MSWLRNIGLGLRSIISFGLIGLIVLLLGLFALERIERMNRQALAISEHWVPALLRMNQLGEVMQRADIMTFRMVVLNDAEALAANRRGLEQALGESQRLLERFIGPGASAAERQVFEGFLQALEPFGRERLTVIRLAAEGRREEAIATLNGPIDGYALGFAKASAALADFYAQGYQDAAAQAQAARRSALLGIVAALGLAALATLLLAYLYSRSIVRPLAQAAALAEAVAGGDLTHTLAVVGRDEPAQLLRALLRMQTILRQTLQSIVGSSDQLAAAAQQLQAVADDTSRGLHEQNGEIEQAATAVNEMTMAVDHVAQNAAQTADASRDADQIGRDGHAQVVETLESIARLSGDMNESARHVDALAEGVGGISRVLEVIRTIAEQTNLLALNAAIEAARAGEAGRGFAVVADEVRALAHRTQQSTGEIERMIASVQHVSSQAVGSMHSSLQRAQVTLAFAERSGQALERIASAITTISERNLVIASAAEQQAQVAREVDRGLVCIRDLSLRTAAGAEQVDAANGELARLAAQLKQLVVEFRI
ncbi:Methyl-accepting chemotaxis protein (MCP) signaling domain protein [compost metagenome]